MRGSEKRDEQKPVLDAETVEDLEPNEADAAELEGGVPATMQTCGEASKAYAAPC